MPRKYTEPEAIAAFWSKVQKSPDPDGCWLWVAGKHEKGYGILTWKGKGTKAHRVSWELLRGPIPDGLWVLHNCPTGDNPTCCNPAHCFLGTHAENMADAATKGRMASGDRSGRRRFRARWPSVEGAANGRAKLTDDQVREIRQRRASGETILAVAVAFGSGSGTVSNIAKGRTWKHVA